MNEMNEWEKKKNIEIHIEKDIRRRGFSLIIAKQHGGHFLVVKDVEFVDKTMSTVDYDQFFQITDDTAQYIMDDLYRAGVRPSDEIKKDDLILTLQKEIDKRDKWIEELRKACGICIISEELQKKSELVNKLLDQFVLKDEQLKYGRRVLLENNSSS